MNTLFLLFSTFIIVNNSKTEKPSKVDFDAFENLTKEVNIYRKKQINQF